MKLEFIFAAIKAIVDLLGRWLGRSANREKEKRDAVDETAKDIGRGRPFCLLMLASMLFIGGCSSYIYTVSTPLVFDPNDFQYLVPKQDFTPTKAGYYFANEALEFYIRSKIAEYEIRKRGFFHSK